jgi:hypothetical protein
MGRIRELQKKLQAFTEDDFDNAMLNIVAQNDNFAIDINTEEQLQKGIRSDGVNLPDYSPISVSVFGKRAGPMTLKDTGEFYEGFYLDTSKWPIQFDSKDDKSAMLQDRYGHEIFGLTKENKTEFAKGYLLPDVQAFIRALLAV